jgi:hypothetical protein
MSYGIREGREIVSGTKSDQEAKKKQSKELT